MVFERKQRGHSCNWNNIILSILWEEVSFGWGAIDLEMKVYVVLYDYLDGHEGMFRGVFSSLDKAEDYVNKYGSNSFAFDIFEWNMDEELWDMIDPKHKVS